MSESVSICGLFEFVDYLNVGADVLDKTYTCQTESFRLDISFPRINIDKVGNCIGWPDVDAPTNSVQLYKDYKIRWGHITKYDNTSKAAKEISIRNIYYCAEMIPTNILEDDVFGKQVDNILKTFAEHIYVKHSNAIHYAEEVDERNDYGESTYLIYHNAKPDSQKTVCIEIPADPSYILTCEDIGSILDDINKPTTLPYLICDSARRQFVNGNYREAILNSAMAVEVAIKKELRSILQNRGIGNDLIVYTINKADGLPKLEELAKLLNYPIVIKKALKDDIFTLRNRVIHAGCSVTKEHTKRCLETARRYLLEQPIAMFE